MNNPLLILNLVGFLWKEIFFYQNWIIQRNYKVPTSEGRYFFAHRDTLLELEQHCGCGHTRAEADFAEMRKAGLR